MFYPILVFFIIVSSIVPASVGETKMPAPYKKTAPTVSVRSTDTPPSAVQYASQSNLRGTSMSQTKSEQGVTFKLTPVDNSNTADPSPPVPPTNPSDIPPQPSFDKYDGDCPAHPTVGRCADKCADPTDILVGYDPVTDAAICRAGV